MHAGDRTMRTERHLADVVVVADAQRDDVGVLGGLDRRRCRRSAVQRHPRQGLRRGAVVDDDLVAGLRRGAGPSAHPSFPFPEMRPCSSGRVCQVCQSGGVREPTDRDRAVTDHAAGRLDGHHLEPPRLGAPRPRAGGRRARGPSRPTSSCCRRPARPRRSRLSQIARHAVLRGPANTIPYTRLLSRLAEGLAILTPHSLGRRWARRDSATGQSTVILASAGSRNGRWSDAPDGSTVRAYNVHLSPHEAGAGRRRAEAVRLTTIVGRARRHRRGDRRRRLQRRPRQQRDLRPARHRTPAVAAHVSVATIRPRCSTTSCCLPHASSTSRSTVPGGDDDVGGDLRPPPRDGPLHPRLRCAGGPSLGPGPVTTSSWRRRGS